MQKTIGIVGGMGPLATCDLFQKVIQVTDADCDQNHVRVCVDSNTEISDRTAAIINHGKDPLPEMVKSAVRLQGMGADVLIMPCNTAHYFYDRIVPFVDVPFLHMPGETADALAKMGVKRVGLLATDGTIQSGVYKRAFEKRNLEMDIPSEKNQKHVMDIIYKGVKAGNMTIETRGFVQAMEELLQKGSELLVLGCTELPVAFQSFGFDYPNIDPTLVLASRAAQFVGARVKENMKY